MKNTYEVMTMIVS